MTFAKTVHDTKAHANTLYLSYCAGRALVVDITGPSSPTEIARHTLKRSDICAVFLDRNYILASDIGSGMRV